ncbi:aminoglycoside adenylyltransferase domain-containing protein [Brevibacterium zhoupengii]|uniref:aminoglycoside adenylyltransferase domain-containing protein n=1 Tax=Brevibacterium zhoupengii TaxID=2898795 RepID=UPI001E395C02|nr:aminoglycoside adenylyltransferase domain-containing protein [Brevibacterium zhoupengii]
MDLMLPKDAAFAIDSYLRAADRLLPGAITACAVGGSIALDAYRPGRSDIDLAAIVSDEWRGHRGLMARLRLLHLSQLPRLAVRAARGRGVSACCNTVFVWESEAGQPVTRIRPIASHVGEIFDPHGAFDVNPVIWKELVDGGISVRGDDVSTWGLDPEPDGLRDWVARNLDEYWAPLARSVGSGKRRLSASEVEWCLLGPARMHHTLVTGKIISKEAAGRYAADAFPVHAPIIKVALARVRHDTIPSQPPREYWRTLTAEAMQTMLAEARRSHPPA